MQQTKEQLAAEMVATAYVKNGKYFDAVEYSVSADVQPATYVVLDCALELLKRKGFAIEFKQYDSLTSTGKAVLLGNALIVEGRGPIELSLAFLCFLAGLSQVGMNRLADMLKTSLAVRSARGVPEDESSRQSVYLVIRAYLFASKAGSLAAFAQWLGAKGFCKEALFCCKLLSDRDGALANAKELYQHSEEAFLDGTLRTAFRDLQEYELLKEVGYNLFVRGHIDQAVEIFDVDLAPHGVSPEWDTLVDLADELFEKGEEYIEKAKQAFEYIATFMLRDEQDETPDETDEQ